MTAARVPLFDTKSGARSAAKRRGTAKALRLRQMIVLMITTGMLVLVANRCVVAGDSRGARLAAICASCHRLDGRDKGIPPIVGLDQMEFVNVMAAFKSGERSSQIMHAIALSLSDGEVSALAAYLSVQPAGTKQR
jgi:cytochrome subunit of sulfide dehydrogenase